MHISRQQINAVLFIHIKYESLNNRTILIITRFSYTVQLQLTSMLLEIANRINVQYNEQPLRAFKFG